MVIYTYQRYFFRWETQCSSPWTYLCLGDTFAQFTSIIFLPFYYETQSRHMKCLYVWCLMSDGLSEEVTHTDTSTHLTLSFANNNTFIQWIVWNWFTDFFQNLKKCSKFQKFMLKSCIWNFFSKSQKMFKISKIYVKRLYLKFFFKISKNVQNFKKLC